MRYRDYLAATVIVACQLVAGLIAVGAPLLLFAWLASLGLWPLGLVAFLLYIPIGAFAAMVSDRLDP